MSLQTLRELISHFWQGNRWFLIPFLLVLLAVGALLAVTSGMAVVAPFVYAIF